MKVGASITKDLLPTVRKNTEFLTRQQVLVGYPGSTSDRKDEDGGLVGMTNAALGYIHEHGAPEVNLPARPHIMPGIRRAQEGITRRMYAAARAAIGGDLSTIDRNFSSAGMLAVNAIVNVLNEGVPPPLADSTLRARARKYRSRWAERNELARRKAGFEPGMTLVKPLIDTGQLKQAVTYVVRDRSED